MSTIISVNGAQKATTVTTITDLLRDENIDLGVRFLAVAINGTVVPRSKWDSARINPGDDIEIVRPAPGG